LNHRNTGDSSHFQTGYALNGGHLSINVTRSAALLFATLLPLGSVDAAELNVAVETSTDMPMARIQAGGLQGGIHRDIGLALGRHLDRTVHFVLLPRKRLKRSLETGEVDIACHFLPAWLPGDFAWTTPFMPNALLLVSHLDEPQPKELSDLSDQPVGTVLGFVYPEVEAALGTHFVRDDAVNAIANLRKLAAGRLHHALVGQVFLEFQQHDKSLELRIHPPLVIHRYEAQCAVSKRGQVSAEEVDDAIGAMKRAHEIEAIYAQYR
jgi:polar amino acid transport system substrate-binding protein